MDSHRGEPCPQFSPNRRRVSRCGAAPFDAPQHNSFLLALLNQSQRPAPLPRAKPAGVKQVWKAQRRTCPLPEFPDFPCLRHWWALLALASAEAPSRGYEAEVSGKTGVFFPAGEIDFE